MYFLRHFSALNTSHLAATIEPKTGEESWADMTDEDLPVSNLAAAALCEPNRLDLIVFEKYGIANGDGVVSLPLPNKLVNIYNSLLSERHLIRVASIGILQKDLWDTHTPVFLALCVYAVWDRSFKDVLEFHTSTKESRFQCCFPIDIFRRKRVTDFATRGLRCSRMLPGGHCCRGFMCG